MNMICNAPFSVDMLNRDSNFYHPRAVQVFVFKSAAPNDVPPSMSESVGAAPSVAEHAAPESEDAAAAMSGRSESNASPTSGDDAAAGTTEEEAISLDGKADGDEASSSDAKDDEVETHVLKEKYTEDQKRRDDAPKCDFEECDGKPASSVWVSKKGLESRLSCDDCQRG